MYRTLVGAAVGNSPLPGRHEIYNTPSISAGAFSVESPAVNLSAVMNKELGRGTPLAGMCIRIGSYHMQSNVDR